VDEGEAASGRACQRPFGHERRERRPEERVDRVPALAQDARAGLGREWMAGCDGAPHPERLLRSTSRIDGGHEAAAYRVFARPESALAASGHAHY
jgi:hypothetical protein